MTGVFVLGHAAEWDGDEKLWRFCDTGEPVRTTLAKRLCPKCQKPPTVDGHDPCIANLPGVTAACCGHGVEIGYLYFENGIRIAMSPDRVEQFDPSQASCECTRTDCPSP